jgi:hypothetical protein
MYNWKLSLMRLMNLRERNHLGRMAVWLGASFLSYLEMSFIGVFKPVVNGYNRSNCPANHL